VVFRYCLLVPLLPLAREATAALWRRAYSATTAMYIPYYRPFTPVTDLVLVPLSIRVKLLPFTQSSTHLPQPSPSYYPPPSETQTSHVVLPLQPVRPNRSKAKVHKALQSILAKRHQAMLLVLDNTLSLPTPIAKESVMLQSPTRTAAASCCVPHAASPSKPEEAPVAFSKSHVLAQAFQLLPLSSQLIALHAHRRSRQLSLAAVSDT